MQVQSEIAELNSPTALRRFGAPFRSEFGEVSPLDSELPILRFIFVHHVRKFPFLDQAREKEFWQDKLQVFLESFANKNISSSEDRHEETKRRKLAKKCEKLVELMMVSGIPTASGYEERIRFSEMEVVDRGANEQGLLVNVPEGNTINSWDVNVAGVRTTLLKRHVRYHQHAVRIFLLRQQTVLTDQEFLLRVHRQGHEDIYVGRRFGDFARLHKRLRTELPGKVLPPLPRKNKSSTTSSSWFGGGDEDDDNASVSSISTGETPPVDDTGNGSSSLGIPTIGRPSSRASTRSKMSRASGDFRGETVTLYREEQRVSLRAFLRTVLQNERIASSKAMEEFLTSDPIELNEEELVEIDRRKALDSKRIEEQRQFYEIARKRARELDVYMEKFRRDIVERSE